MLATVGTTMQDYFNAEGQRLVRKKHVCEFFYALHSVCWSAEQALKKRGLQFLHHYSES